MSTFWVGDDVGRVLGPVSLQVVRDLLSRGRLQGLTRASRDGTVWVPLLNLPELAELMAAKQQLPTASAEEARALAEVARLTGRGPSEVLELPARASLADARGSFFAKVKPYHPSKLPPGASQKLRLAHEQLFAILSSAMAEFQKGLLSGGPERPAVPSPAPPSFEAEAFGGWRRDSDQTVCVELNVTPERSTIFTDVQAASITNGGFFLPCEKSLPIFQTVEVKLHFQTPTRDVTGPGRVVCEVNLVKKRGVGVRFAALGAEDKRFIEYFVRRSQLDPKPR